MVWPEEIGTQDMEMGGNGWGKAPVENHSSKRWEKKENN
jgi:hypothetical protein